ncbi:AEC family transporter [Leptotrichia sp. OH3620_COT-345]|uniref:AEC family transporter n=1 Tax=Leptotrichia sp. OH3620_COT-345 TaxID=2491048 RepID=UPI000F6453BE|nr:AEC family transporter [Leptotrichia sp. OH3620_COT-345]RRD39758.1 AEC family transporter [Leptotrichia sp. OH3620_COT-345]
MIFIKSLESIFPIIFMIGIGYVLRKKDWFHDSFSENVSKVITNIALPASIYIAVSTNLTVEMLILMSDRLIYTFGSFIVGYISAVIIVKIFKIKQGRRGIFINAFVNANTIFIGLPLNIELFGEESLPYYLMYYIANTVSIWTFGSFFVSSDSKDSENKKGGIKWKKIFSPPLIGFIVALLLLFLNIELPKMINSTMRYVGSIVTPLSLMYIGIVLSDARLRNIHFDRDTILALTGRFLISPLIMVIILMLGMKFSGSLTALDIKTYIVQSAAPVFAVLPILANEAEGDIKYATNVVTTSTILFAPVISVLMMFLK